MAVLKLSSYIAESLEEAFEMFVDDRQAMNVSKATIRSYNSQWTPFATWYRGSIHNIDEKVINKYKLHLKDKGWKDVSINSNLRHLKAILRFWHQQDLIQQEVKVTFLKVQEEGKDIYTDEELKILLKKPIIKYANFTEFRTWAVVCTFAGTGMRVGTLVNLKIQDLDFDNMLIRYTHTKNNKFQYVPMSASLLKVLKEYLRHRGGTGEDYLFPSENNTKLLETTVTHNIKKYCKERGINKGNCHLFRHTFAKHWLLSGGEGLKLQKILGHSSMKMVQHYANLYGKDLAVGFEKHDLLSSHAVKRLTIGV